MFEYPSIIKGLQGVAMNTELGTCYLREG